MNKIMFPTKLYIPKYSGNSLDKSIHFFKENIHSMEIYSYVEGNFWSDIFIKYKSKLISRIFLIKSIQNRYPNE